MEFAEDLSVFGDDGSEKKVDAIVPKRVVGTDGKEKNRGRTVSTTHPWLSAAVATGTETEEAPSRGSGVLCSPEGGREVVHGALK